MKSEEAERKIEEYRRRFRDAPIGVWRTDRGSIETAYSERVIFSPDGTGAVVTHSGFSEKKPLKFTWEKKSPFIIEICIDYREFFDDGDEEEDTDVFNLEYNFAAYENGFGINKTAIYQKGLERLWHIEDYLVLTEASSSD